MLFKISSTIPIGFLVVTVASISGFTALPIDNTYVWWFVNFILLIYLIKARKYYFNSSNKRYVWTIRLYIFWNIICIVRGFFIAENYWEWKNLIGVGMILLIPVSINISTNAAFVQKIIALWIKVALPAFLLFYFFFIHGDAAGRYLAPICFLLIFLPVLKKRWKTILLLFTLFIFLGDLGARSNVIKFSIPILISVLYYLPQFFSVRFTRYAQIILMLLPFCLFSLGVTNTFNIFKMDEYTVGSLHTTEKINGGVEEVNLKADTRTFLYEEVLLSAFKYNYIMFGRTPARGNDSESFGLHSLLELKTGKMERFSNEVSILNIFTWTGAVGVFFYFIIFFQSSFLAVNYSNNIYIRLLGVYVSFRWAYAWVEDFSNFDLSYLFLWIMIGICMSKEFREMNNLSMKYWILGIFGKKYRPLQKHINQPIID